MEKVMKAKYETLQEFVNDLMTPEMIKERRENFRDFQGDMSEEFCIWEFQSMVRDIGRFGSYGHKNIEPPFKVADYQADADTDHDHGAWTDVYVLDIDGRFYEVEFDYYGQGDFGREETDWRGAREVFPKTITKVIYE